MTTSDKLREFGQKVIREYGRWWGIEEKDTDKFLSDLTAILEQHKEMILREELIAYDKFLSNTYWGISHITKREEAVDEYLKSREK